MSAEPGKSTGKTKSKEEIYAEFQMLRNQQRNLVTNLNTLEMELKEHKTVIDTLKTVDENRRCFRLIGGVLVEQTVKQVLPQLSTAKDKLDHLIETGKEQITKKGEEILKYKEEHNIKVQGQASTESAEEKPGTSSEASNRNVLVVNN